MPPEQVRAFSDIAHENDGYVSSGGWIETVLRYGDDAVDQYLKEAKDCECDRYVACFFDHYVSY